MKLFDRIEGALETVYEGIFRKGTRTKIQPVEIGRSLMKVMEAHKRISISKTYVPNSYEIFLHPDQWVNFRAMRNTLSQELKGVLVAKAEKEELSFIGNLTINFVEDGDLDVGNVRVTADYEEQSEAVTGFFTKPEKPSSAPTQTLMFSSDALIVSSAGVLLYQEENETKRASLENPFSLGRSSECDLILKDNNVSRVHAWFRLQNGSWVIQDNDSTNGTFVNNDRIKECSLRGGDTIQIGTTIIKFEDHDHE